MTLVITSDKWHGEVAVETEVLSELFYSHFYSWFDLATSYNYFENLAMRWMRQLVLNCHCQLFLIHWHSKKNLRWLSQFCVGFFLVLYLIKCVFSFINLFFSEIQSGHLEYIRSWNILKTNPWRHVTDLGDITESHPHYPSLHSLCREEHRSVLKGTQVSFNR